MIDATIEIAYFDARKARRGVPAQLEFEGRGITLVTRNERDEPLLWSGERRGQGHYLLTCADADMDASLHRFADSAILEGFWRNGMERGFWRVHMPVDALVLSTRRVKAPTKKVSARPVAKPVAKRGRKRVRQAA